MQSAAVRRLLKGNHFPPLFLERQNGSQRVVMGRPRNMVAGAEGAFQDVAMWWVARDATEVQTVDSECIP